MAKYFNLSFHLYVGFRTQEKKIILDICFVLALVNDSDAAVASEVRTRFVWSLGAGRLIHQE